MVGLDPVDGGEDVSAEDFTPSQDRVPAAAQRVEEQGEDAFHDPSGGQHVDLSQLKNKLAGMGDASEGLDEESDEPATQVMTSPPEITGNYSLDALKKGAAKLRAESQPAKAAVPAPAAAAPAAAAAPSAPPAQEKAAAVPKPMTMPRPRVATTQEETAVELRPTGVRAWQGFEPPEEDFSIVPLVEAFLNR
jgi:hypothetical protein